jgi:hypothetical protein
MEILNPLSYSSKNTKGAFDQDLLLSRDRGFESRRVRFYEAGQKHYEFVNSISICCD